MPIEIATSRTARRNGVQVTRDVEQLLRDALPEFVSKLLPQLSKGAVWFIFEDSPEQLTQMLIPKDDLLEFLDSKMPSATPSTRNALRSSQVDSQQILWVAYTRGENSSLAHGRMNLDMLRANA